MNTVTWKLEPTKLNKKEFCGSARIKKYCRKKFYKNAKFPEENIILSHTKFKIIFGFLQKVVGIEHPIDVVQGGAQDSKSQGRNRHRAVRYD